VTNPALAGAGMPGVIPWALTDIDGNYRPDPPTIGAHELSPSPTCSGTPNAGSINGPVQVCSSVPYTLNLVGATTGPNMTYQWQSSTAGATGPWTNVGTGSLSYSASQTVPTWYQVIVTCTSVDGGTSTTSVHNVGQDTHLNCYCTSTATSTADEEIFNVTFGTLNNTSACGTLAPGPGSVVSMYSNYKTLPPTTVLPGEVISFSLGIGTCGGNYSNRVAVFIDWNQNGLLTDPGEQVFITPT
ncbi:MAG: hypothetical protein M3R08_11495, partial [Bacteroidota bacterium]|nr:hypothetical protein [Bacteroidota bacterium]